MSSLETSHPWLKFSIDADRLPRELWVTLGECACLCRQISAAPLPPSAQREIRNLCPTRGIRASLAMAGNGFSEEELSLYLQERSTAAASAEASFREVDNLVMAIIAALRAAIIRGASRVAVTSMKAVNGVILHGVNPEHEFEEGAFRSRYVQVGNREAPPSEACEPLLGMVCEWLNDPAFISGNSSEVIRGIIRASLVHLYLSWIQPFYAGNGRTARIEEFFILVASGVPWLSAILMAEHYLSSPTEYAENIEAAMSPNGDVSPSLLYAAQGLRDKLEEQLGVVRSIQAEAAHVAGSHGFFKDKRSGPDERRKRLAPALADEAEPVPLSAVAALDPRLAAAYREKSQKTLYRDIRALTDLGLISKQDDGIIAKKDHVLSLSAFPEDFVAAWLKRLDLQT